MVASRRDRINEAGSCELERKPRLSSWQTRVLCFSYLVFRIEYSVLKCVCPSKSAECSSGNQMRVADPAAADAHNFPDLDSLRALVDPAEFQCDGKLATGLLRVHCPVCGLHGVLGANPTRHRGV